MFKITIRDNILFQNRFDHTEFLKLWQTVIGGFFFHKIKLNFGLTTKLAIMINSILKSYL